MFLTPQIETKPDDVAAILAEQNWRILSDVDSSIVTGDIWCSRPSERNIRIYDKS